MRHNIVFYISVVTLSIIGAWGVAHIVFENRASEATVNISSENSSQEQLKPIIRESKPAVTDASAESTHFQNILTSLHNGSARQAALAINEHYSSLSSNELEQLRLEFIKRAANSNENDRKQVLLGASAAFDDKEIWALLSLAAESAGDWRLAYDAQLRTSQLVSDPAELSAFLNKLVHSSSFIRASHEQN